MTAPQLRARFPTVDVLPDGSLLAVGGRTRWTPTDGGLPNAFVHGPDGQLLRSGCLGDGIADVQVGVDGTIWVGYFDEGIYGNLGWGSPGPRPIGRCGIVSFTPELEQMWALDTEDRNPDFCDFLNVSAEPVHVVTTFERSLQEQIGAVAVRRFSAGRGTVAAVSSGRAVALVGAYGSDWVSGDVSAGGFRESGREPLLLPDGATVPRGTWASRGRTAHLIANRQWYSVALDAD